MVLGGEAAALWELPLCNIIIPMPGLPLCLVISKAWVFRILGCLQPSSVHVPLWRGNLLELVVLEEMGHLGQSKHFFFKKSDSTLWLEIGILILIKTMFLLGVHKETGLQFCSADAVASLALGISPLILKASAVVPSLWPGLCYTWRLSSAPLFPASSAHSSTLPWVCNISHYWTWSINDTCIQLSLWPLLYS